MAVHRGNNESSRRAYYAASLTGVSELERTAFLQEEQIIQDVCDKLGVTLLGTYKHPIRRHEELTPESIYNKSCEEIRGSNIVIVNCQLPSFWTGQAVEIAANFKIPVVLIVPDGVSLSRTVSGSPTLKHEVRFATKTDLQADLAGVLSLAFKTAEFLNETPEKNFSGIVEVVSSINAELINYLKQRPEGLYTIEPRQFEELVAELLANFGWEVTLTPKTKDGGYDIFAIAKNIAPGVNAAWVIECKRYMRERKVGVEIVRALYGAKTSFDGVNAMLATTSSFTRGAQQFKSSRYNLELRDYAGVVEWLEAYRLNPDGTLYIQDPNRF